MTHFDATTRTPKRRRAMTVAGSIAIVGVAGAGAASTASAATSTSSASTVLAKIKYCESGGNYQAVNSSSGASGAYQFLNSTWKGLSASAGYATAASAPASVQDAAALELYNQAGTSPWAASSSCWSSMTSVPTTSSTSTSSSASTTSTSTSSSANAATSASSAAKASTKANSGTSTVSRSTTRAALTSPTHASAAKATPAAAHPGKAAPKPAPAQHGKPGAHKPAPAQHGKPGDTKPQPAAPKPHGKDANKALPKKAELTGKHRAKGAHGTLARCGKPANAMPGHPGGKTPAKPAPSATHAAPMKAAA